MTESKGIDSFPIRSAEPGRIEAFSDGVFAVAITMLVLDIRAPQTENGRLIADLIAQWPAYLAYAMSFAYVSIIWFNHHVMFNRIERVDKGFTFTNLVLLFTTALLPFPTAVLADALQAGDEANMSVAIALYALVAGIMCGAWLMVYEYVVRHPALAVNDGTRYFHGDRARALLGITGYTLAGGVGFVTPVVVPLVILAVLPAFYFVTSHGMARSEP
ncbi:TMEM175 family protein [Rhodococcus sp. NPDC059234]|uniref:TMEM175 family protein n=1 Tax=Rhodococcus sp. NPDC059234 TaxID=3346781 RepID=UPI00366DA52A